MSEFPDSVWIRSRITEDGRTIVERCPFGNARGVGTVKYIRADIAAERIAELEAERRELAEALKGLLGCYNDNLAELSVDWAIPAGNARRTLAKINGQQQEKDDET